MVAFSKPLAFAQKWSFRVQSGNLAAFFYHKQIRLVPICKILSNYFQYLLGLHISKYILLFMKMHFESYKYYEYGGMKTVRSKNQFLWETQLWYCIYYFGLSCGKRPVKCNYCQDEYPLEQKGLHKEVKVCSTALAGLERIAWRPRNDMRNRTEFRMDSLDTGVVKTVGGISVSFIEVRRPNVDYYQVRIFILQNSFWFTKLMNFYRIFVILVLFWSALKALQNETKITKIR